MDWARTNEAAKREVDDFAAQFATSARRLTQGRGQRPFVDKSIGVQVISMVNEKFGNVSLVAIGEAMLQGPLRRCRRPYPPHSAHWSQKCAGCYFGASMGAEQVPRREGFWEAKPEEELRGLARTCIGCWNGSLLSQRQHSVENQSNSEDHVGVRLGVAPVGRVLEEGLKCCGGMEDVDLQLLEELLKLVQSKLSSGNESQVAEGPLIHSDNWNISKARKNGELRLWVVPQ